MRFFLILLPFVSFAISLPPMGMSEFADTEVVRHFEFNRARDDAREVNLHMEFEGSSVSSMQVALGQDANGDGVLSLPETDAILGWRCGGYFVEWYRGEQLFTWGAATNTLRMLDWRLTLTSDFTPKSLAITNEQGAAFTELCAECPAWLYNKNWNLLRLTARGTNMPNERITFDIKYNSLTVILR